MPLQQTTGNSTTDAYGGGAAVIPNYIEDVFSTWLYTGNGSTQTITNGIDLAGKGGLVWAKTRSGGTASDDHWATDTNIYTKFIKPNTTDSYTNSGNIITGFNNNGYGLGANVRSNTSGATYASWTFRKQPKFFDAVTYTGTGSAHTIAHSLGSVPGCIMVKDLTNLGNWQVYHNGLTSAAYSVQLNLTDAQASASTVWNSTAPTASVFSVGTSTDVNNSGDQYVAYLFAHNAGGFGLTGTDNVISCGSFTTDGSGNATVSLGYEPQWILFKRYEAGSTGYWELLDTMRGMSLTKNNYLEANTSVAESSVPGYVYPTATGFNEAGFFGAGAQVLYIAIRRGPMKVPTDATKVFAPVAAAFSSTTVNNTGFVTDMVITRKSRSAATDYQYATDRLRGANNSTGQYLLETDGTYAEAASSGRVALTGTQTIQTGFLYQANTTDSIAWSFGRAPSFFDEVCYTGNSTAGTAITHNLAAIPGLLIVKCRSNGSSSWRVLYQPTGIVGQLESTATVVTTNREFYFGDDTNYISPTSSVFTVASNSSVNTSARTYVAYLFATCAGVSKVGSYTGNGTTQAIACGFTGGARFVLIKRTDSTGDWYVYDTARGMTVLTDPYLFLNSTAAETATLGSVITSTGGFTVNAAILAAINTNAASYIFLAIA